MPAWLQSLMARLGRRRRFEADMAEELAFHLQSRIDDLVAAGLSPDEAVRRARLEFGGVELYKERSRDSRRSRFAPVGLGGDIRYALRTFRKSPAFVAAAVLTLALGIGANTAIFSVVYGLLMRPLAYRQANRLVLVEVQQQYVGARTAAPVDFTAEAFREWRDALHCFDGFAFYAGNTVVLSTKAGTDVVSGATVSANFFSTLDGGLAVGRRFTVTDNHSPSIVISSRLWQRLFDASPAVLGRQVALDSKPYTIVGVAAPSFRFPAADTDVWIPIQYAPTAPLGIFLSAIGRLKPDVSLAQARSDVRATATALAHEAPRLAVAGRAELIRLRDSMTDRIRPALLVLWAAVGLVLLVACANVINLLLARDATRARETAVRVSLGASRGRLIQHSLVDTGLLATAGCVLGLVAADASLSALRALNPIALPLLDQIQVDRPVLLFALGLTAAVTMVTGLTCALRRGRAVDLLKGQNPGRTGKAPGRRLRAGLCIAQLSISLVLLVGATLLGRSLVRLLGPDIGVRTAHVMTASINMPFGERPNDAQMVAVMNRAVAAVRALPGAQSAGIGTSLPPDTSRARITLNWRDPVTGAKVEYAASAVPSTPDFFRALGIRLLEGRFFTAADDSDHPQVMIMSRQTALRFFGKGDPIGKTMTLPTLRNGRKGPAMIMVLVGVVDDVKYLRPGRRARRHRVPSVRATAVEVGLPRRSHRRRAGRVRLDAAPGDRLGRSNARRRHGEPAGDDRRQRRRAAAIPDVPARLAGLARHADGGPRPGRRHRLLRLAADDGDRHPDGARCEPGGRDEDDPAGGTRARGCGAHDRSSGGLRAGADAARPAVRHRADRPGVVHRGGAAAVHGGPARLLPAGAPRHAHRSHHRPAGGVDGPTAW